MMPPNVLIAVLKSTQDAKSATNLSKSALEIASLYPRPELTLVATTLTMPI
jgi:hypothetical protein